MLQVQQCTVVVFVLLLLSLKILRAKPDVRYRGLVWSGVVQVWWWYA